MERCELRRKVLLNDNPCKREGSAEGYYIPAGLHAAPPVLMLRGRADWLLDVEFPLLKATGKNMQFQDERGKSPVM